MDATLGEAGALLVLEKILPGGTLFAYVKTKRSRTLSYSAIRNILSPALCKTVSVQLGTVRVRISGGNQSKVSPGYRPVCCRSGTLVDQLGDAARILSFWKGCSICDLIASAVKQPEIS